MAHCNATVISNVRRAFEGATSEVFVTLKLKNSHQISLLTLTEFKRI